MKKIVIFGGSNGLGAAIVKQMLSLSPKAVAIVVDACPLSYENPRVRYVQADFSKKYRIEDFFFPEADAVVYTAGLGRIDRFEDFGKPETDKYFRVNTTTPIELIELYSKKLLNHKEFHFGVVTSIAALVGSPLFAIYSATKAALSKYAEAVNVELEKSGTPNRILDYCPGFIKGSNFYGLGNQPGELEKYAEDFVKCLLRNDTFQMALGDETYLNVLARYKEEPHRFGLESYDYKIAGGAFKP